jgi:hypothetical protein
LDFQEGARALDKVAPKLPEAMRQYNGGEHSGQPNVVRNDDDPTVERIQVVFSTDR